LRPACRPPNEPENEDRLPHGEPPVEVVMEESVNLSDGEDKDKIKEE